MNARRNSARGVATAAGIKIAGLAVVTALVAAGIAAGFLVVGCGSNSDQPAIRVGFAAPLTGSDAKLGQQMRMGAALAMVSIGAYTLISLTSRVPRPSGSAEDHVPLTVPLHEAEADVQAVQCK